MASAVIANEASWKTTPSQSRASKYMGKIPFSNPKFSKKRQLQAVQPVLDVQEFPAVTQSAASDDASSINRRPTAKTSDFNSYVTFNVRTYSRKELVELKKRLVAELEQIRQLKSRIESTAQIRSNGSRNLNQNPKLSKKLSGIKRPLPNKDVNLMKKMGGNNPETAQLMKNCGQILSKLMRHKHGYIFNTPVDVVNLNLNDYHDIIKTPMDLGTIKSKLGKNLYESPRDFAADVRLTFNNAMRYNPKGHEVYILAEQLSRRFEELYAPIRAKTGDMDEDDGADHQEKQLREEVHQIQEVQASSWDHHNNVREPESQLPVREKPANPIGSNSVVPSSGLNQNVNPQSNLVSSQLPVRTPSPMRAPPVKPVKQPKPKAKDPNKREMSLEEKHKLGMGLQNLPQEKMEQVVQIIRKRNGHLRQEGDEIGPPSPPLLPIHASSMKRPLDRTALDISTVKRPKLESESHGEAETATGFFYLDENLLFEVLKHVDARTLGRAACVSRQWHRTVQDERLWELICTKHWPNIGCGNQQLRSVVLALGGFRRLHSQYLWPLSKPQSTSSAASSSTAWAAPSPFPAMIGGKPPGRWGKDEMQVSLSLLSIRYYEKMNFANRGR